MDKYKLTNDKINLDGIDLYAIIALKNFGDVKAGDIGGHIESLKNLSQEGNCWIYPNNIIAGDCQVIENCKINGELKIIGGNFMFGNDNLITGDLYAREGVHISGHAYQEDL